MRAARFALSVIGNRTGGVPRPSWCTYMLSYRCNARCGMCDSWRMKPGAEMSVEEVDRVFEKIGALDVVRLTGGEPFLRDDLPEIAARVQARSNPLVLHVTTNGSLPERVARFAAQFEKPERLQLMVSLDGMSVVHDESRGPEVTFDLALETITRLVKLRDEIGISVSVNHTVISPESLLDHQGIRERLDPLGVDVHSVIAYAESSMYGIKLRGKKAEHLIVPRGYPLHPSLAGADVIGFVEHQLGTLGELRDPVTRAGKRYYLQGLLQRLQGREDPAPKPRCVALRSHIRILPDGRVPVCQFNTETIGNLVDQDFDELWRSVVAKSSRSWVDRCPGCWAECEVVPNAVYTGDILRAVVMPRGAR
jgi:MoaA/NifB/PqqE/SkfB family radical SAM enzyme